MERLISILVMAAGGLAAGVGALSARSRWRVACRAHRRTETLCAAMPDGWHSWFLGGFAGLTMGTRGLQAAAAWVAWTLAGIGLIGLGLRLL